MTELLAEELALPPVSPAPVAQVLAFPNREAELAIEQAERAMAQSRPAEALTILLELGVVPGHDRLALRSLLATAAAHALLGERQHALELAERARSLSEEPGFGDLDRAEALFRLGCCRFELTHTSVAASLFTVALELCERAATPTERLRARLHEWRSRCRQRHAEWDAARADAERSLELALASQDQEATAHAHFQASIVAEHTGQTLLARFYAEEAMVGFEQVGDRLMLARILDNLGGLSWALGDAEEAVRLLSAAKELAREAGGTADAAKAAASLAQVHLRCDRADLAEREARAALALLRGRADLLHDAACAELVLGRALLAQGRHEDAAAALDAADGNFAVLGAPRDRAAVLVARGDLASAAGDSAGAARLYRSSAELLQDVRF